MRKLILLLLVLTLCGCAAPEATVPMTTVPETTIPETTVPETTVPETTIPPTTVPETTTPPTTVPLHSEYYLEGLSFDDLVTYWDEVVLKSEYSFGDGDPSLVQKWLYPIWYSISGDPTEEDIRVLEDIFAQLNEIPGFPGIEMQDFNPNLTISFQDPETFRLGFSDVVNGEDAWAANQYWYYTDTNEIYSGRIGYRTDILRPDQDSILVEEVINCLGITDTVLREDSIVYQHSNSNLELSDIDWVILKLLYNPAIQPGITAEECHAILAELYY